MGPESLRSVTDLTVGTRFAGRSVSEGPQEWSGEGHRALGARSAHNTGRENKCPTRPTGSWCRRSAHYRVREDRKGRDVNGNARAEVGEKKVELRGARLGRLYLFPPGDIVACCVGSEASNGSRNGISR